MIKMSPYIKDLIFHKIHYFTVCSFFDGTPKKFYSLPVGSMESLFDVYFFFRYPLSLD